MVKKDNKLASGIGLGMIFGVAIGVATDNLGLWIGVGLALGAGIGNSLMKKDKKNKDDES